MKKILKYQKVQCERSGNTTAIVGCICFPEILFNNLSKWLKIVVRQGNDDAPTAFTKIWL